MKEKTLDQYNKEHAKFVKAMKAEGMKPGISFTKDQSKRVDANARTRYPADNA